MKSLSIRTKKPERNIPAPQQHATGQPVGKVHAPLLSPCEDLHTQIAKRAYELYGERGYRHGSAFDDWLEAEREILSQVPPV